MPRQTESSRDRLGSLPLVGEEVLEAVGGVGTDKDIAPPPSEDSPKKVKKGKGHGRQRLPKYLQRRRVEYDLQPEERHCPQCQRELRHIGEEVSERLEYVPASLYVIQDVCHKYACPQGCTVLTAQKPMQPIEKGLVNPEKGEYQLW